MIVATTSIQSTATAQHHETIPANGLNTLHCPVMVLACHPTGARKTNNGATLANQMPNVFALRVAIWLLMA
jgi:hypothetical protein